MRYPISYNFWSFEDEISQYPPGSQEPLETWDLYLPVEVNQKSLLRSWLLAHAAGWWSLWEGAALSALSGRGRCGRPACQGPITLPLPGSAHASFTCLVSLPQLDTAGSFHEQQFGPSCSFLPGASGRIWGMCMVDAGQDCCAGITNARPCSTPVGNW